MIRFAVCGAGRIGRVHAANIALHPEAELSWVLDPDEKAAAEVAARSGARWGVGLDQAIGQVDAVVIASPTPTHVELIERAARAGLAVLCEKPIDLDLARVDRVLDTIARTKIPFLVGFNRRFDPSFVDLKSRLAEGLIGRLEMLSLTSRDPAPPPNEYIRQSGGLFRDMMIHDFDMVRWLTGGDPVEVYATASNVVDSAIGAAGDVDTAVVVMKTATEAIVQISNSRRATYGYDQRIEAFGSEGMLVAENAPTNTVQHWNSQGISASKPQPFFLERYARAYRAELDHFVEAVQSSRPLLLVGPHDARQALALAEAARTAWQTGQPVSFGG